MEQKFFPVRPLGKYGQTHILRRPIYRLYQILGGLIGFSIAGVFLVKFVFAGYIENIFGWSENTVIYLLIVCGGFAAFARFLLAVKQSISTELKLPPQRPSRITNIFTLLLYVMCLGWIVILTALILIDIFVNKTFHPVFMVFWFVFGLGAIGCRRGLNKSISYGVGVMADNGKRAKLRARTKILSALVLVVCILAGAIFGIIHSQWFRNYAAAAAMGVDLFKMPKMVAVKSETGEPLAITEIAGVQYRIPVGYLQYPVKPSGERELLITALLPDMKAITPEYTRDHPVSWSADPRILILVQDLRQTTSFQFRLTKEREIYGPLYKHGETYNLHAFLGSKGEHGRSLDTYDRSIPKDQLYTEFYTNEGAQEASIYISCSGSKAVPNPGCDEVFTSDGLLYTISFRKEFLRDWQLIQQSAIALIEGFHSLLKPSDRSKQ